MVDTLSPLLSTPCTAKIKSISDKLTVNRKFVKTCIKNSPLEIIDIAIVRLTLRLKDRELSVDLFIIKDQTFATDIILGRVYFKRETHSNIQITRHK